TLLNKEQGITIILVEHNTEYLFDFADRLIVLDKGELVMEGKPREVFEEADFLRSLGIKIPTSVKIGAELKKKGLLERAALNDKELVDAIRTFLKG
ncbi:ABC transporter ATP-binding protein, partial [Thermococci archaeon]